MSSYREVKYWSVDGLELYARDYSHPEPKATILCMPGLTRNSADFDFICERLNKHYRLIAVDQRGRGRSEYDPNPENYLPATYVGDMLNLLDSLAISEVLLFGTSLGGLMAMVMVPLQPERFSGYILNDIGPEVGPAGLVRIKAYVGAPATATSWEDAVVKSKAVHAGELLALSEAGWLGFCRAIYRQRDDGQLELAYDPAIAEPMQQPQEEPVEQDLWGHFMGVKEKPVLVLRGSSSDILSAECLQKMRAIKPELAFCSVANRGHAPLLDEPDAVEAIEDFLAENFG